MKRATFLVIFAMLACTGPFASDGIARAAEEARSAAEIFKLTLSERGVRAAVEEFRRMMADTTGTYVLDGHELFAATRELERNGEREGAIELLKLLAELYPEEDQPWQSLGSLYLTAGDRVQAERCYGRALELNPGDPYAAWIVSNMEELAETERIKLERDRYAPGENTGVRGPYLGEEPPGGAPRVFAPGIINSAANEFSITFTPDGREIYFSRSGIGIMVCRLEEGGWTAPERVRFFDDDRPVDEPNVSPDGKWVYFNARSTVREEREIYRAKRMEEGWGEPEYLFPGMYATSTLDGTVYYTGTGGRPDYGIIVSRRPEDGGFAEPDTVGGGVNSPSPDAHPFIAPDGSFILFDSYRVKPVYIYISYRLPDGSWGDAMSLNDRLGIPPFVGQCALTPDGRYLFYSLNDDMYWVSASFIEELRPE